MRIVVTTEEAGDEVKLKILFSVRRIGGISAKAKGIGIPPRERRINLDLPMWKANEKPFRPQREKEDN